MYGRLHDVQTYAQIVTTQPIQDTVQVAGTFTQAELVLLENVEQDVPQYIHFQHTTTYVQLATIITDHTDHTLPTYVLLNAI